MATEAAHGESPTDYIVHHLTHLKVGSGFWTFHVDTLLVSASLALLVAVMLVRAARVKSNGAPSGLRAFVEWVYEFVDGNVADIYPGNRAFLVALGMTLFTWVVAMNAMDLLPLDLPGGIASMLGAGYFRVVPTADLNGTVAMADAIMALTSNIAMKQKKRIEFKPEWFDPKSKSTPEADLL